MFIDSSLFHFRPTGIYRKAWRSRTGLTYLSARFVLHQAGGDPGVKWSPSLPFTLDLRCLTLAGQADQSHKRRTDRHCVVDQRDFGDACICRGAYSGELSQRLCRVQTYRHR